MNRPLLSLKSKWQKTVNAIKRVCLSLMISPFDGKEGARPTHSYSVILISIVGVNLDEWGEVTGKHFYNAMM